MTPERVELMLSRWGAWRVAGAAGGIGYPRAAAFARLVPGTPGPMVLLHDRDREAEQFDGLMRLVLDDEQQRLCMETWGRVSVLPAEQVARALNLSRSAYYQRRDGTIQRLCGALRVQPLAA